MIRAPRRAFASALFVAVGVGLGGSPEAFADAPGAVAQATPPRGDRRVVDRVAVRYFAPETGGVSRPRFITERQMAFEARLEMMALDGGKPTDPIDNRHVRAAVEHHVAEELLARLPVAERPPQEEFERVIELLRTALEQRVGGREALYAAARVEGIAVAEVEDTIWRQGAAAFYVDRAVSPILTPTQEQLREAFRSAAHPYKTQTYEQATEPFARWYLLERLRVMEQAFLQAGRSRVKIFATSPVART